MTHGCSSTHDIAGINVLQCSKATGPVASHVAPVWWKELGWDLYCDQKVLMMPTFLLPVVPEVAKLWYYEWQQSWQHEDLWVQYPGMIPGLCPALQSNAVSHWLGANLESALSIEACISNFIPVFCGMSSLIHTLDTGGHFNIKKYMYFLTGTANPTIMIGWFHSQLIFMMVFPVSGKIGLNTLRPRKNGCHFPDEIFKCSFLNENVWISIKISLKFVPKVPIDNIPALVQIMAWRRQVIIWTNDG